MRRTRPLLVSSALTAALAACAAEPAADARPSEGTASAPVRENAAPAAQGGPPLGRYVCRQHTTTMGYLALHPGGAYEVSGVRGRYRHDAATGAMEWDGGSYDEWSWDGTYEHVARPAGDGRPDEHVIRLVSESDGLKINCYRMADQ